MGSSGVSDDKAFQNLVEAPDSGSGVPKVMRYKKPELEKPRHAVVLARTDTMFAAVQVIRKGGENKLHSHPNMDGLWFVLRGRARFYTTNDELVAEVGPNEAVLIPHGYPYWRASAGDEELEILQVSVFTERGARMAKTVHAEDTGAPLEVEFSEG